MRGEGKNSLVSPGKGKGVCKERGGWDMEGKRWGREGKVREGWVKEEKGGEVR